MALALDAEWVLVLVSGLQSALVPVAEKAMALAPDAELVLVLVSDLRSAAQRGQIRCC